MFGWLRATVRLRLLDEAANELLVERELVGGSA